MCYRLRFKILALDTIHPSKLIVHRAVFVNCWREVNCADPHFNWARAPGWHASRARNCMGPYIPLLSYFSVLNINTSERILYSIVTNDLLDVESETGVTPDGGLLSFKLDVPRGKPTLPRVNTLICLSRLPWRHWRIWSMCKTGRANYWVGYYK